MKIAAAVLAFLLLGSVAGAQQSDAVHGSQHPELISDTEAYGRILGHFSEILANPEVSAVLKIRLIQTLGLSSQDNSAFQDILADHKSRKDAQLTAFNKKAAELYERGESIPSFNPVNESITTVTRMKIQIGLSAEGARKLNDFVQQQKSRLVVPAIQ